MSAASDYLFVVPIRTQTESNANEQPFARASRAKKQRLTTWAELQSRRGVLLELRGWPAWSITLTRVAPRTLDDDNLPSSLKHVRDQVAASLRVGKVIQTGKRAGQFRENDNDPRLRFSVEQRQGPKKFYAVEIRFRMGVRP